MTDPGPPIERPCESHPSLCVLASGSTGNASVLVVPRPEIGSRRVVLFDAGLSPRKTFRLLAERGIDPWEVDDLVLTHLDHDHWHRGWHRQRPERLTVHLHRRHLGRAEREGSLGRGRTVPFEGAFELASGLDVDPVLMSHDQLGVAAFRVSLPNGSSLGFATDLGHTDQRLIEHLAGVDVLAIESNYCPQMQARSGRPAFLKQRITGGSGHLSNQEAADAAHRIAPRSDVVLLHLSRQCNHPSLARRLHDGRDYRVTVSEAFRPTGWVRVEPGPSRERPAASREVQLGLFIGQRGDGVRA